MSKKNIAMYLLSMEIGKKLMHKELIPSCIFDAMINFVSGGCKNRSEYESIVNFVFANDLENKKILLDN